MPGREKYIVAKGVGGLGNRILAATTAILYSKISGRKLVIDWSDGFYAPPGVNAFPNYFDCSLNHPLEALPPSPSIYPDIWHGRLDRTVRYFRRRHGIGNLQRLSIDVAKADYDQDVVLLCACNQLLYQMNHYFTADFTHLRALGNKTILRTILHEDMPLRKDLAGAIETIVEQKFEENNIGVHVRYTDIRVSLDRIYQVLERRLRRQGRAQVFLATDSQDIETEVKRRFDPVVTVDKWFPASGQKMHENRAACPDLVQNGVEALRDLHLLSRCGSIIYSSRSTFGVLASLLNGSDRCYDIERSLRTEVKRLTWQVLEQTRPLRRRCGLTKSAFKSRFSTAASDPSKN